MTDRHEARAKGEATRKAHAAARAAQWEQERQDKALVAAAMRNILGDQGATAREKIFATLTLDNVVLGVELVPTRAAAIYDRDVDLTAFKAAVDAITEAEGKGNT